MARRRRRAGQVNAAEIEKRIISVDKATQYVKILVYARNKQGKTRFAASAPNPLILDVNERGTRSAKGSGAHVYPVRQWTDISDLYWYLRSGNHRNPATGKPFESVAIDTVTAMLKLCMRHVLKEGAEIDPNKDPTVPDKRAWGKVGELMRTQILQYRNLPMHVIFVAQERVFRDDDAGTVEHVPNISGQARDDVTGAVDIIGRLYQREVEKTVRVKGKRKKVSVWEDRMLVGTHDEYVTGDRTFTLPRIVRNPTMPLVIEAFNKE